MNISDIMQFISTVGFPIAITCWLLWDGRMSRQEHKEEMDKLSGALENNTLALTKLSDSFSLLTFGMNTKSHDA